MTDGPASLADYVGLIVRRPMADVAPESLWPINAPFRATIGPVTFTFRGLGPGQLQVFKHPIPAPTIRARERRYMDFLRDQFPSLKPYDFTAYPRDADPYGIWMAQERDYALMRLFFGG